MNRNCRTAAALLLASGLLAAGQTQTQVPSFVLPASNPLSPEAVVVPGRMEAVKGPDSLTTG